MQLLTEITKREIQSFIRAFLGHEINLLKNLGSKRKTNHSNDLKGFKLNSQVRNVYFNEDGVGKHNRTHVFSKREVGALLVK